MSTAAMGGLCISIDLELAWGTWDKPHPRTFAACAEKERDIVRALLARFERHDVPVTWAIVARLLERDDARAQSTRHGERIWYAPDIVEEVQRARPGHDIGSHGYAHIYYGETTRDDVRDDLAAARRVHDAHGLPFRSFVFPRNQVAHADLLRSSGVDVYRGVDVGLASWARHHLGGVVGKGANLVDKALPTPPATVRARRVRLRDNGASIVEIPGSLLLLGRGGLRRIVHPQALRLKARLGLEAARLRKRVFHLWFHPSNFYDDTDVQLGVLDGILNDAAALRDKGHIEVRTMASFADA